MVRRLGLPRCWLPLLLRSLPSRLARFTVRQSAGKWAVITISGSGFYGQPKITSNAAGSKFGVTKDTGKSLTVRVWTKKGISGEHTLTVHLASGKSGKANYKIVK